MSKILILALLAVAECSQAIQELNQADTSVKAPYIFNDEACKLMF